MDVFDAVRTVLAVRRYQDKPVPEPTVRRIVEAGRLTGSAKNMQPWHFIIIQDRETLRRLPFGYPVGVVGRGKKQRKALGAVAHRERYGQPFD